MFYYEPGSSRSAAQVHDSTQQVPSNRLSVPELIQQLQVTQNELDNLRVWYQCLFLIELMKIYQSLVYRQIVQNAIHYMCVCLQFTSHVI